MTSENAPAIDPAAKPRRRTFSPEYKLRIVAEYDAAPKGEKGAVLRRECLYDSHVKEWRAARDAGALDALADRRTAGVRAKKSAAELENCPSWSPPRRRRSSPGTSPSSPDRRRGSGSTRM